MEAKGICQSEDNGWGHSDYAILLQCRKCNKITIVNKKANERSA